MKNLRRRSHRNKTSITTKEPEHKPRGHSVLVPMARTIADIEKSLILELQDNEEQGGSSHRPPSEDIKKSSSKNIHRISHKSKTETIKTQKSSHSIEQSEDSKLEVHSPSIEDEVESYSHTSKKAGLPEQSFSIPRSIIPMPRVEKRKGTIKSLVAPSIKKSLRGSFATSQSRQSERPGLLIPFNLEEASGKPVLFQQKSSKKRNKSRSKQSQISSNDYQLSKK